MPKKETPTQMFPVNFVDFLRTPFLQNISRRLLLKSFLMSGTDVVLKHFHNMEIPSTSNYQYSLLFFFVANLKASDSFSKINMIIQRNFILYILTIFTCGAIRISYR